MSVQQKSWWRRIFGSSIFGIVFGKFFEIKNNTAGLIATILVSTLCFIVIYKVDTISKIDNIIEGILNVIFVVVGYYFGAKQRAISDENDE